jgi:transcriptional regulator with XRE-family HTH domain
MCHMKAAATNPHTGHTFTSGRYLRGLLEDVDRAAISERMQRSMKEAGYTQDEIADLLHVSKRTVQTWVSQKIKTVPYDMLDEWAEATNVSKRWLLHGEADTAPRADMDDRFSQAMRDAVREVLETEQFPRLTELAKAIGQLEALLRELLLQLPARGRKAR